MTGRGVQMLIEEEGYRDHPYLDSKGYWTIGVGHLIDNRRGGTLPGFIHSFPISRDDAMRILDGDIADRESGLDDALAWWRDLSEGRRFVLTSMAFQLGIRGLLCFRKTLALLEVGDYQNAADEMLDSRWARIDSPERAYRHAEIMRTGRLEA